MHASAPRLDLRHLSKSFGSVQVLHDVHLCVAPGEIHGLAGQNGSGKSTLIKVLTGVHASDAGAELDIDGAGIRMPVRWRDVHAAGVTVVHQDLGLVDHLTVSENVCVGGYPTTRLGRIDRNARDRLADKTLRRLGISLEPTAPVAGLTAAERAEVAIARALRDHAPGQGLMILDESTRALSGADFDRIHAMLRRIVADGAAAILISHNMRELVAVTDRVTVLRDGRVASAGMVTAELGEQDIARAMLGGSADISMAAKPIASQRESVVAVRDLCGHRVSGVSFEVGEGEILGITGLPGNGYEEIPYLIAGSAPATKGTLAVGDLTLGLSTTGIVQRLAAGVALVPERRDRDGLALEMSVQDNLCVPRLRQHGSRILVGRGWQREQTKEAIRGLDIRPANPRALVKELSGGNQQKVLLAKWLTGAPRLLVLHEPTQAVDVGARKDILERLLAAAANGTTVVMVSSEPDDLVEICDRVLLYRPGGGLQPGHSTDADALVHQIYELDFASTGAMV